MSRKLERRKFGRRQSSINAWIIVRGRPRLSCRIANLAPTGALLELAAPPWLPFRFELVIDTIDTPIACEFRHKTENGIGVHFCDLAIEPGNDLAPALLPSDTWAGRAVNGGVAGNAKGTARSK